MLVEGRQSDFQGRWQRNGQGKRIRHQSWSASFLIRFQLNNIFNSQTLVKFLNLKSNFVLLKPSNLPADRTLLQVQQSRSLCEGVS